MVAVTEPQLKLNLMHFSKTNLHLVTRNDLTFSLQKDAFTAA